MPAKRNKKKIIPRWKKLLLTGLAGATIIGAYTISGTTKIFGEEVTEVADGDTFFISNHQPVRLAGVFAPETEYCLGPEAKSALSTLILHKKVFIREPITDGRGRIIALVYADGMLINEVMIKAGLAEYHNSTSTQTNLLHDAGDFARNGKRGIYGPICQKPEPPNPKCRVKGNFDEYTRRRVYFLPNCLNYNLVKIQMHQGDSWFCTEAEAEKAGFMKSENCN